MSGLLQLLQLLGVTLELALKLYRAVRGSIRRKKVDEAVTKKDNRIIDNGNSSGRGKVCVEADLESIPELKERMADIVEEVSSVSVSQDE